jgi:hypothetical protein
MLLLDIFFRDRNLVKTGSQIQRGKIFGFRDLVKQVLSPMRAVAIELGVLVDWNEIYAEALVRPRTVRGTLGCKHNVTCVI